MAGRKPRERRGDTIQCKTCGEFMHYSRFYEKGKNGNGSIPIYEPDCKLCHQTKRNDKKNADRPFAIFMDRTKSWAQKLGTNRDFLLYDLNWISLLPVLRAMFAEGSACPSCAHSFVNERDIQIEHRAPPRHPQDWARHHAHNLGFLCQSCNLTKTDKPYEDWLDEREDARQSFIAYRQKRDDGLFGGDEPMELFPDVA